MPAHLLSLSRRPEHPDRQADPAVRPARGVRRSAELEEGVAAALLRGPGQRLPRHPRPGQHQRRAHQRRAGRRGASCGPATNCRSATSSIRCAAIHSAGRRSSPSSRSTSRCHLPPATVTVTATPRLEPGCSGLGKTDQSPNTTSSPPASSGTRSRVDGRLPMLQVNAVPSWA